MARYKTPSAREIAIFDRAIDAALATGSARSNPAGKTITARRHGTCPITGDHISPGDSITKTDEGWALTEHVGGAMENPRGKKRRMEYVRETTGELTGRLRMPQPYEPRDSDFLERVYGMEGDLGMGRTIRLTGSGTRKLPARYENPAHKTYKVTGLTSAGSVTSLLLPAVSAEQASRLARQRRPFLGKVNVEEMHGEETRDRRFGTRSNPSAGGRAMRYAKAHGVTLKEGWNAVKSGRA